MTAADCSFSRSFNIATKRFPWLRNHSETTGSTIDKEVLSDLDKRSATELEMIAGLLRKETREHASSERCRRLALFFQERPKAASSQSRADGGVDDVEDHQRKALASFRRLCLSVTSEWNKQRDTHYNPVAVTSFDSGDGLSESFESFFRAIGDAELPTFELAPFEQELRTVRQIQASKTVGFVADDRVSRELKEWEQNTRSQAHKGSSRYLIVAGKSGTGKSSLLAWASQDMFTAGGPVYYRRGGATLFSSTVEGLLRSIVEEARREEKEGGQDLALGSRSLVNGGVLSDNQGEREETDEVLLQSWAVLIATSAKKKRTRGEQVVTVVFDGLDCLEERTLRGLAWLPSVLPPFVRVVLSSSTTIERQRGSDGFPREVDVNSNGALRTDFATAFGLFLRRCPSAAIVEVGRVKYEQSRKIIDTTLRFYGKKLSEKQWSLLFAAQSSEKATSPLLQEPLSVFVFTKDLLLFVDRFEDLDQSLLSLTACQSVEELLFAHLTRIETSLNGARSSAQRKEKASSHSSSSAVAAVLSVVLASHTRLEEAEVTELCVALTSLSSFDVLAALTALKSCFIVCRGGLLDFGHRAMRKVASKTLNVSVISSSSHPKKKDSPKFIFSLDQNETAETEKGVVLPRLHSAIASELSEKHAAPLRLTRERLWQWREAGDWKRLASELCSISLLLSFFQEGVILRRELLDHLRFLRESGGSGALVEALSKVEERQREKTREKSTAAATKEVSEEGTVEALLIASDVLRTMGETSHAVQLLETSGLLKRLKTETAPWRKAGKATKTGTKKSATIGESSSAPQTEERMERFRTQLFARLLLRLSSVYAEVGRFEDATQNGEEAVTVWRRLAKENGDNPEEDVVERDKSFSAALHSLANVYFRKATALNAMEDLTGKQCCLGRAKELFQESLLLDFQRIDSHRENGTTVSAPLSMTNSQFSTFLSSFLSPTSSTAASVTSIAAPLSSLFATTLHSLALIAEEDGSVEDAILYIEASLRILSVTVGEETSDVAAILNNLALLYSKRAEKRRRDTGREDEETERDEEKVLELLHKAVAIEEAIFGSDHPALASTLFNYGKALLRKGRLAEADNMLKRSQTLKRRALPLPSPFSSSSVSLSWSTSSSPSSSSSPFASHALSLATTLSLRAQAVGEIGRIQLAERLFAESLWLRERVWGVSNALLVPHLAAIGTFLLEKGCVDRAVTALQKALFLAEKKKNKEKRKRSENSDSSSSIAVEDVSPVCFSLARVCQQKGDFAKALRYYERGSLSLRLENVVKEVKIRRQRKTVVDGKTEEKELLLESLNAFDRTTVDRSLSTVLYNMAGLQLKLKRFSASALCFEASAFVDALFLGPDHPTVAETVEAAFSLRERAEYMRKQRENGAEDAGKEDEEAVFSHSFSVDFDDLFEGVSRDDFVSDRIFDFSSLRSIEDGDEEGEIERSVLSSEKTAAKTGKTSKEHHLKHHQIDETTSKGKILAKKKETEKKGKSKVKKPKTDGEKQLKTANKTKEKEKVSKKKLLEKGREEREGGESRSSQLPDLPSRVSSATKKERHPPENRKKRTEEHLPSIFNKR